LDPSLESLVARIRLILVDDSADFARVAAKFLQGQDTLELVGVGTRAQDAFDLTAALAPDLVLLDLAMPGQTGLEAIPGIKAARPGVKVVALTLFDSSGYRHAAMAAGADGFVSKRSMAADLIPAICASMGMAIPEAAGNTHVVPMAADTLEGDAP